MDKSYKRRKREGGREGRGGRGRRRRVRGWVTEGNSCTRRGCEKLLFYLLLHTEKVYLAM